MKKIVLSFVLMFFMMASTVAQNIPVDPAVRIGTLSNGMKYYIRKNTKPEKKVEMRLAINAGSILEDENQRGLAHFMEHMNFNGTKNFPDNKLVDFLQSLGIKFGQHLNAYTSFDETVYMLPVPLDKPGNLDSGLKVMEDWAFNALLTDEQINKERGVVLEEMRIGLGADKRMMDQWLPVMLHKSHYAERLPIGKKEVLEKFSPEVIRKFHRDWYRPDLMSLAIVGDINVDEVEQKIKKNFSSYKNPATPRPRTSYDLPNHKETLVSIVNDPDATMSRVQFLMKDQGNYQPDVTVQQYDNSILESLTATMINNRLRELINSTTPPFTFGSVYHGGTYARTKEAFQGMAITKDGGQLPALKVLLEEVERARKFGFTQSELDRAKSQMMSGVERMYNDRDKTESGNLVDEYVRAYLENEPIPGIEWEYKQYQKYLPTVTLAQTNQVIKDYARDDSKVVVITGPKKDGLTYATKDQVLKLLDEVKLAQLEPYKEKATITNLVKPFKSTGKIVKTENDAKLGTTTLTLSNGAKVTYKKTDFKDDEIVFTARSLGGTSLLNDADFLKTTWAYGALAEAGVNGYDKTDLANYTAGKQVSVNPMVSTLFEGLNGRSSTKDFGTMMELIYAYFTGLNYDPKVFNAYKEKQNSFLSNMASNPQFYFSNEFQKFRNQKNPRFTNSIPREQEWNMTDYKKAYDVYKQKFANAGNFHFYFVGNVDDAKMKEYATQYLASLPSTGKTTNFADTKYRPVYGQHTKVYKKGADPKSMVNILYGGETTYNEKEDLALMALGEVATIKVIEKLREDEAGIYGGGARGGISKVPYGNYYFTISFPCGPENVDKLTKAALAEVQNLINKGPEQKDLDKFREGEFNDYKTQLKDNNFWLSNLANYQLEGGDKYDILNYESKVKALTVKDLQNVAKKYLTKDKLITATLMPEDGWENAVKAEQAAAAATPSNATPANSAPMQNLTAQQVIDKYIAALGGRAKLEAVKSIKSTSKMKVQGMDLVINTLQMAPNKMKMTQTMMGQEAGSTVFDGENGYMMQMGQKQPIPADQIAALKKKKLFDVLDMNAAEYKVEKATENGRNYYVLVGKDGKSYYDPQTGLMAKGNSEMGDMTVVEYKTTPDGIKYASKMSVNAMGQALDMEVTDYVLNSGVSAADFK